MTRPAVVRPGSCGEAVRDLQLRLVALGFAIPRSELGAFGTATEAAVRAFQAARAIRVDGICGAETWAAVTDSAYRLGDRLLCARQPMLRGDDVSELQRRLNALGFDAGKQDGIFGPSTLTALTEFQRNAGITSDGIGGRETIAALDRLGARADGAVAVARERDALRDPRALEGTRVYVAAGPGFEQLAEVVVEGLHQAGAATVLDTEAVDESAVAASANASRADLFLALRSAGPADHDPEAGPLCRCCYYASGSFRSEAGFVIATALARGFADTLTTPGAVCGRAYTVLRETRMAAVVCEVVLEGDAVGRRAFDHRVPEAGDAAVRAIRQALEHPYTPGDRE